MIFTLRFKFNLHRFSRIGLEAVKAEFSEKVIAYNFWRNAHSKKNSNKKENSRLIQI
jgi:hypothetical protein